VKDFAPLILAGQTPNLLVVNNDLPFKSVKELIDAAKAKPARSATARPAAAPRTTSRWNCSA
jgi:tripartite-type tricarboxylate transporter receptor subunit TctC